MSYIKQLYYITPNLTCERWWYKNLLHRLDGPAVVYSTGIREYWINGYKLPSTKIIQWLAEQGNPDIPWNEEICTAFLLRWIDYHKEVDI